MTKQLPKKLFVKIEKGSSDDDAWFVADAEVENLVDMGPKIKVGVYQLVEIIHAEAVVQTSSKPSN
jgi:hypothetical protein